MVQLNPVVLSLACIFGPGVTLLRIYASLFSMGSLFSAFRSLLVHFLCWFHVYIIIVPGSLAVNKQVVDVCGDNITNWQ